MLERNNIGLKQSARSVVKKYRKLSLKKEMKRLRRVIPNSRDLREEELIEETVSVIERIEQELLTRIQAGEFAKKLENHLPEDRKVDIIKMRQAMLSDMGY